MCRRLAVLQRDEWRQGSEGAAVATCRRRRAAVRVSMTVSKALRGGVTGLSEVNEIDQREHEQHSRMGVASADELLAECAECALAAEEAEQRPTAVLNSD